MKTPLLLFGLLLGTASALAGNDGAQRPLEAVPAVDLNRYMGRW